MKSKIFKLTLLTLLTTSLSAHAADIGSRLSPRIMQGIRPLGMGGAFIAMDSKDENTLFYNPAGINDFSLTPHMQLLLPSAQLSAHAIKLATDSLDLVNDSFGGDQSDTKKLSGFQDFSDKNSGQFQETVVNGSFVSLMQKYVALSLLYDVHVVAGLRNPASLQLESDALVHTGVQVGSAFSLFDKNLQVGAAIKVLGRDAIQETFTIRDAIAGDADNVQVDKYGFGVGGDIGVKGHIPWDNKVWSYLNPTFATTLQDIGKTRFSNDVTSIPQSWTVGAAVHPNFWLVHSTFDLDYRDLDHRGGFLTKTYMGYEMMIPDIGKVLKSAAVRFGLGQGYLSAGIGADIKIVKINLATFGREAGSLTHSKQIRSYGAQLALGF